MLVFIARPSEDLIRRKQRQKSIGKSRKKQTQETQKKTMKCSPAETQCSQNKALAEIKQELCFICGAPSTVLPEKPGGCQKAPTAAWVAPTLLKAEKSGKSRKKEANEPQKKNGTSSESEAQRALNKTLAEIKEELRIICGPPST
ncbi:hypothetical protein AVEN_202024-1, partial [Araneus ventricosus]